jgi:hypothetical protein
MKQNPKKQNVANFYSKLIFPIVICVMMVYTSCRKTENAPAPTPATKSTSNEAIGTQMAVNLAQSLSGTYGGVNLNQGVDSVSIATGHGQSMKPSISLCGFSTDSLVNYNYAFADTVTHVGGHLKFYWDCENGRPSGYCANDSLTNTTKNPTEVYIATVKQNYTIKCLDDKHYFVGVNGTNDFSSTDTFTAGWPPVTGNAHYVLTDLKIDVCKKDILSGTATFTASGSNNNLNWTAEGTITFLGNHMADITINGTLYHVDLSKHKSEV